MSNFQFLENEWQSLYSKMIVAEERIKTEPVSTASYCRIVLEECVHTIFDLEQLEKPFNTELVNLLNDEQVKALIPYQLREGLTYVRKTGNNAVHYGNRITATEALISIKYLYSFLKWFAVAYSPKVVKVPGLFDESLIETSSDKHRQIKEIQSEQQRIQEDLLKQVQQLQAEKEAILTKAQESEAGLSAYKLQVAAELDALQQQKSTRTLPVAIEFTEAETRKHLIDSDIKEAGWFSFSHGRDIEFPVKGMPITSDNPNGNGYVDYVLWDDNGLPLALIEAKKTTKDLEIGKHQAFLYANCLESMYGQRPIIFYTNGYETKIWEDNLYSTPRRVYGYYTKDELKWLIQKRSTVKDLRTAKINIDIAGRGYQKLAIQSVAETFVADRDGKLCGNKRRSLLVMATGSGKTRTAAALVDVLVKNNWAKRVLFLADRNALVTQAKNNFNEYCPELSAIDLTQEKERIDTRLVFSTYPSMMNKIDNNRDADGRFYGVGHFDLIIVDEAHRSIYNRYRAIFEYFDALVVGLTATPKDAIDFNTFELFGCSNDDPTYMYELSEAVNNKFLVPYKTISVSTDFLKSGIKYSALSDKEKEKYEQTFEDKTTGLFPELISKNALNKWLFNKDTVNKVLDALMQQGIKIEGGDKIGRTIIFATNQQHAKFIVDCFTERYPQYPAGFIAMIHNEVSHAQSLIDSFCDKYKENMPQIAVSVDMMDTGIDAVRVVNLVFFKSVKSYSKFWQMIGRGTRLCPDLFGVGQDKEHFLIFDTCANFEFFEVNANGVDNAVVKPITQQIFESRVNLSRLLQEEKTADELELANKLLDIVHNEVVKLDKNRYQVKMHLRYVDEYSDRDRWNKLDSSSIHDIETHLSELPVPETVNEMARRFDLMMLKMQIATIMMSHTQKKYENNLVDIAEGLSKKYSIPVVNRAKNTIESIMSTDFFKGVTQKKLDEIREELRDLIQYLDVAKKNNVYTNIIDSELTSIMSEPAFEVNYGLPYRKRVESFLRENKHHITISKLINNVPITQAELVALEHILFDGQERGTKDTYTAEYGSQPLGVFIRSILGLDVKAAQEAFSEFLNNGSLRADQMVFIQNIITYLTKNGTIEPSMLFEPPFTDINDRGLNGVFEDDSAYKIISIVEHVNENAMLG
ncbi:MAG: DEAD/DEAH box helicase family protein [Flavobacterium sp.]|nr:DEAD/DEAH box helicase family protein [Flavobacterium sp.]